VRRRLHGDAASAATACRFARDILTAWGHPALSADACLLLEHLVTQAVRQSIGDVEVRMTLHRRLHIEVHADTNWHPAEGALTGATESPPLLDRLAHAWGTESPPGEGQVLWCELTLSDSARR
jgi:hypothetical protein